MRFAIILFLLLLLVATYSYVIYRLFKKQANWLAVAMIFLPFMANEAFEYYSYTKGEYFKKDDKIR
jgi:hypothetical protein